MNLRTIILIDKNNTIQIIVDIKPKYTSGSVIYQPLVSMDRKDVVAIVSGKQALIYRSMTGIPSTGQMTPKKKRKYKKLDETILKCNIIIVIL